MTSFKQIDQAVIESLHDSYLQLSISFDRLEDAPDADVKGIRQHSIALARLFAASLSKADDALHNFAGPFRVWADRMAKGQTPDLPEFPRIRQTERLSKLFESWEQNIPGGIIDAQNTVDGIMIVIDQNSKAGQAIQRRIYSNSRFIRVSSVDQIPGEGESEYLRDADGNYQLLIAYWLTGK